MPVIAEIFPYILLITASFALLFHPVQGARAVLFFAFGYFFSTVLYQWGYFSSYETRYHPLIIASTVTILLYHSLDMTIGLLIAWITELCLIVLNIGALWSIVPAIYHWNITVLLNVLALGVLTWNWWHGNRHILYSRLFDLDIPLGFAGAEFRFVDQKTKEKAKGS